VSTITVQVAPGLTRWAHGDTGTELAAGVPHELDLADQALATAVAAAVDAGALLLVAGRVPAGAVETQKQSLAKLQAAAKARAPLYEERDAELARADPADAESIDPDGTRRAELMRDRGLSVDAACLAVVHEDIIERWEARMADAAQSAVEA